MMINGVAKLLYSLVVYFQILPAIIIFRHVNLTENNMIGVYDHKSNFPESNTYIRFVSLSKSSRKK